MKQRIEKDSIGEILVDSDKLWGAQTQRSFENFKIGTEKMPVEIIRAITIIKRAAAVVNFSMGNMSEEISQSVTAACDKILAGGLDDQFPLSVWQTGSGTQTNMNVNEVIAGRAADLAGSRVLHPNDDVNKSQSSNDTFPTAMSIASVFAIEEKLIPAVNCMIQTLDQLEKKYMKTIKTGRTHLQDAVPLTFGQEVSGWKSMMEHSLENVKRTLPSLKEIALGGTAVGTGLNAPKGFAEQAVVNLNRLTGKDFVTAPNKFHALSSKDAYVAAHGALKGLAADLMKMANDIRWLASGPRCGMGEITIPSNEPGSSIMPGKVNPTQTESATMVAVRVMGNDTVVGVAASQGNFELNVYMPVMAEAFLESVNLLAESLTSLEKNCVRGIEVNEDKMTENAEKSLMVATALNTHIGYEKAAQIAKKAHRENSTLREAGINLGMYTGEEYDQWVNLLQMTGVEE